MKRIRLTITLSAHAYGVLEALLQKEKAAYRTSSKSGVLEQAVLTLGNGRLSKADVEKGIQSVLEQYGE